MYCGILNSGLVAKSCQRSLVGYSPWDSPGKNIRLDCHFLLQDLPNPGIEPRSPALQAVFTDRAMRETYLFLSLIFTHCNRYNGLHFTDA